jgi:integrase
MSKPQQLPSGRWRIRAFDANGARISRTFPTFAMARAELARLEVETAETVVRRERFGSAEMTVAEAWSAFMGGRRRAPDATERRFAERGGTYTRHYTHHIEPYLAGKRLSDLTPAVLRQWINTLVAKPIARPGTDDADKAPRLSPSTIRGVVVTLRQIAKSQDVPLLVILDRRLRQGRRRRPKRALQNIDEVRALVHAARRLPWFQVAAAIACYCGARLGEVASLRWRNIDWAAGQVSVEMSWDGPLKGRTRDDGDDLDDLEEGEDRRVLPLHPDLAAILEAWRKKVPHGPDDRVVLVGGVRPLRERRDDVAYRTRSACRRAGLRPITFHALRASYATIAAGQGLPIAKLSALLGHRDVSTTAIYVRTESASAAQDPRALLGTPADRAELGLN